jgi:hypothetical protein
MARAALTHPLGEVARRLRLFLSGLAAAAVTLGVAGTPVAMTAPPPVTFAVVAPSAAPVAAARPAEAAAVTPGPRGTVTAPHALLTASGVPAAQPPSTPRQEPSTAFVPARAERAPPSL